jgi:general stress protein 26
MEKNLHSSQAIKKLQELAGDIKTCMLITSGKSGKHATRPMAVIDTDSQGNLWFFANIHSNKIKDIEVDHQVQLLFAHPGKDIYMDIQGRASLVDDRQYIKDKWSPIVKAWFPGGIDDVDLCLLKVKADEVHYWNTENSKMGTMLKLAVSAVTGKKLEEGVHGELNF